MKLQPTRIISVTPTIDTSAYATGDQLGNLMEFELGPNWHGGVITSVTVVDAIGQSQSMELWLFKDIVGLAADNAAADLSIADVLKTIAIIDIASGDYKALASSSVNSVIDKSVAIQLSNSRGIIYGALVSRGTPTYTSISDLQISIGVLSD